MFKNKENCQRTLQNSDLSLIVLIIDWNIKMSYTVRTWDSSSQKCKGSTILGKNTNSLSNPSWRVELTHKNSVGRSHSYLPLKGSQQYSQEYRAVIKEETWPGTALTGINTRELWNKPLTGFSITDGHLRV